MSVQLVAPHSVAISAMNNISVRSCSALSARGSGNSEKHSANRRIGCSLHIRSYPQNPFLPIWQLLAPAHVRFPCPLRGGVGGGGLQARSLWPPPHPTLPRKGGGRRLPQVAMQELTRSHLIAPSAAPRQTGCA